MEIGKTGVSAIIVDRDLKRLAKIASSVAVMFRGEIAFKGTPEALLSDDALVRKYIGL
jgi:ABC-type branched-subunit amino acid transport system ATPase component